MRSKKNGARVGLSRRFLEKRSKRASLLSVGILIGVSD
jgi:hypothetical protein